MENEFNNTTNDDLARMIARGFEGVDKRFDKIENILLEDHRKRIEKLEEEMKELKEAISLR
jgi:predicted solute-binding protein